MNTIALLLFVAIIIMVIIQFVKNYRLEKRNMFLSSQLEERGVDLTAQAERYNEMVTKAKSTDSLSKLKAMKKPHYASLRHINKIIQKNFYRVKHPHRQPVLQGQ